MGPKDTPNIGQLTSQFWPIGHGDHKLTLYEKIFKCYNARRAVVVFLQYCIIDVTFCSIRYSRGFTHILLMVHYDIVVRVYIIKTHDAAIQWVYFANNTFWKTCLMFRHNILAYMRSTFELSLVPPQWSQCDKLIDLMAPRNTMRYQLTDQLFTRKISKVHRKVAHQREDVGGDRKMTHKHNFLGPVASRCRC